MRRFFASVHDLNIAAMYCDRILLMDRGRIIKAGTPEEILTEENYFTNFSESMRRSRKSPITQKYTSVLYSERITEDCFILKSQMDSIIMKAHMEC